MSSARPTDPAPLRALALPGMLLVASGVALAATDPVVRHPVGALLAYGAGFAAYVVACRRVLAPGSVRGRGVVATVLVVAAICRIVALPSTPSDDAARYVWEARVVRTGGNPYLTAPDDPSLAGLAARAPEHVAVNHPDWPAIYPPLAQWWQAAVVGDPPTSGDADAHGDADGARDAVPGARVPTSTVRRLKLSFLAAEVVLVGLLLLALRDRGRPAAHVLVYAWSPLAVHATASEAHHDVLAATLLVGALLLLERRRLAAAAGALAAAVLAKGFALAALPVLVARARRAPRRDRLGAVGAAALVVGLLATPFLARGGGLLDSLTRFGATMHWNDSLHAVAAAVLPPTASRALMITLWSAVAVVVVRRGAPDAFRATALLVATLLLVLPTVHPWYLVVLLPLLALEPWWGWIALSGTVALTWLVQLEVRRTGVWTEWPALKLAEYAPLAAWLALVARDRLRARGPTVPRGLAEAPPS